MKTDVSELAITGGQPLFEKQLVTGELYLPSWDDFESKFQEIFSRRYYTNHGILAQKFESEIENRLGVKHAVAMTNGTLALIISAKALNLKGNVIVPSYTFVATVQSLLWAGLEPVFCDVDPVEHTITPDLVTPLIDSDVCAILGVHSWDNPCDISGLQEMADKHSVKLYFDACHAFDCSYMGEKIGNFGELEVFSFHANSMLSTAEGGIVCTNDDELAARLRNIRSSYGSGHPVHVSITGNGRFSEAQAALGLLALEKLDTFIGKNKHYFNLFSINLNNIPGITFITTNGEDKNYQYVIIDIDNKQYGLTRDQLVSVLKAENIDCHCCFDSTIHKTEFYVNKYPQLVNNLPVTDALCERILKFPTGQFLTENCVLTVCDLIRLIQAKSETLMLRFKKT